MSIAIFDLLNDAILFPTSILLSVWWGSLDHEQWLNFNLIIIVFVIYFNVFFYHKFVAWVFIFVLVIYVIFLMTIFVDCTFRFLAAVLQCFNKPWIIKYRVTMYYIICDQIEHACHHHCFSTTYIMYIYEHYIRLKQFYEHRSCAEFCKAVLKAENYA